MKQWTAILTLLFSLTTWAAEEGKLSGCLNNNCSSLRKGELSLQDMRDFMKTVGLEKVTQGSTEVSRILDDIPAAVNRACMKFVKGNEYSKWGEFISDELGRGKFPNLYSGTPEILHLCPNFPNLNDDQKDSIFVLKLTLTAYFESSCNPLAKYRGAPNGTAAGLFQQHEGHENKYSRGCKAGDSRTPEGSIRCTLSMLNDLAKAKKNIFSSNAHWEVSRPQNRKIPAGFHTNAALATMGAICKISYCKTPPESCKAFLEATKNVAISEAKARQKPSKRVAQR